MNGPSWLALIAVVWWAALLNPTQGRSFSTGVFDGIKLPAAVVSTDRHSSLATNERQRTDAARGGHSPLALTSAFTIALFLEPIQRLVAISRPPVTRLEHSPAQPRAPPETT